MNDLSMTDNPDLAWDLEEIINRQRAMDFVMQFEHTLCVYSGAVQQLYSNYNIFFPKEQDRKMVILPDPAAYHDTFHGIPPDAVSETGLYIIPGQLIEKDGLFLTNLLKDRSMGPRQIPFEAAARKIKAKRPQDDPFLPLLAKGDLREFNDSWPVLHLHRLQMPRLAARSALERAAISEVINERLEELFRIARN